MLGIARPQRSARGVRLAPRRMPPVANSASGYSAILHDARGRMFMLRCRMGLQAAKRKAGGALALLPFFQLCP